MRYKLKLQLLILPLMILPVLITTPFFIINFRSSAIEAQSEIMILKIQHFKDNCINENSILMRLGVEDTGFYSRNAKRKLIEEAVDLPIPGGYLYILDFNGDIVFHPLVDPEKPKNPDFDDIRNTGQILKEQAGFLEGKELFVTGASPNHIIFYNYYENWNWIIVATADKDVIFSGVYKSIRISLMVLLLSIFVGIVVLYFIAKGISRPIETLKKSTGMIAEGNYDIELLIRSRDEIGILTATFNMMVRKICETLHERDLLLEDLKVENTKLEEEMIKRVQMKNYLDSIVNSMPSALIGVKLDRQIVNFNRQAENQFQIHSSEAEGQLVTDLLSGFVNNIDEVKQAIFAKDVFLKKKMQKTTDSGLSYYNLAIFPLINSGDKGAVIRIDDITQQVYLEEMMIQSEKMLSVGGLAAGMAHEINNPLAGIIQNLQVVKNRLFKDISANRKAAEETGVDLESLMEYAGKRGILKNIDHIEAAAKRAAVIVSDMLSFSRKSDVCPSLHYMTTLLDDTLKIVSQDYSLNHKYNFKNIQIIREYEENLPGVPCEGTKIQQVFLNILKNGAQAMASAEVESPHFVLRIKSEEEMIRIEIEDNGPGMDEELRKRIMEPFFTTKSAGAGTGLGLSISYFIITDNHKGTMSVESVPDRGTTFIIKLPVNRSDNLI